MYCLPRVYTHGCTRVYTHGHATLLDEMSPRVIGWALWHESRTIFGDDQERVGSWGNRGRVQIRADQFFGADRVFGGPVLIPNLRGRDGGGGTLPGQSR